jgi:ribosomal protein S12
VHVTYNSRGGKSPNEFCVLKEDGQQRKFKQSKRGLFYLDTAATKKHTVLAVDTAENDKSNYPVRDYNRAKLARKIQIIVGRPELKDFTGI